MARKKEKWKKLTCVYLFGILRTIKVVLLSSPLLIFSRTIWKPSGIRVGWCFASIDAWFTWWLTWLWWCGGERHCEGGEVGGDGGYPSEEGLAELEEGILIPKGWEGMIMFEEVVFNVERGSDEMKDLDWGGDMVGGGEGDRERDCEREERGEGKGE